MRAVVLIVVLCLVSDAGLERAAADAIVVNRSMKAPTPFVTVAADQKQHPYGSRVYMPIADWQFRLQVQLLFPK